MGTVVDMQAMELRCKAFHPDCMMLSVPGDGDCLATSLIMVLGLKVDIAMLRQEVAQSLETDPLFARMRQGLIEMGEFEKVLEEIRTPGKWLGEEFLRAASVLFRVTIHIETPSGLRIVGDDNPQCIVLLAYNGVHYSPLL